jgi:hypothetical protein
MADLCEVCGTPTPGRRADTRFCGDRCRKRAGRNGDPVLQEPPGVGKVHAATLAELEAVGRADTPLGTAALALAEALDRPVGGMGMAALAREFRTTLAEATDGAARVPDALDELINRRRAQQQAQT